MPLILLQIAITAALGYDSYLAMRHGAGPRTNSEGSNVDPAMTMSAEDVIDRKRLGCYFCNDVIAPVDVTFVALAFLNYTHFLNILSTTTIIYHAFMIF
jgi:hypothetical protein